MYRLLVILWLCAWIAGTEAETAKYKDPKQPVTVRIKDLMSRMSLAEKIGQMAQLDRESVTPEIMRTYSIGSVLSGGGSAPLPDATAKDWIDMVNSFQKGSMSSRLGIPMIYGIDAVHGHNNVYNATIFPHNVGLGATRQVDPDLVKRIGAATALEARATGIPYVFAPCIAVCRDPRWGRCYESYSEDPKVVEEMTEIIPGLQGDMPAHSRRGVPYAIGKDKVAACAKHFVGDGGTTKGLNENNTGFVISDWQGIDRITSTPHENYTYSVQEGVLAGIDMIMIPYNHTEFVDDLTLLVKNNVIPMDRIDDAVQRILLVKFNLGLFENPMADLSFANELGSQAHRDLGREAVRKSLVLLKNGKNGTGPLLPLPKKASRILVAGTHADNLGYQCGGWTINWQGFSGNNDTTGTTILTAIRSTVDRKTDVVFQEDPNSQFLQENKFDYAIVVVGEPPYAETAGDSSDLTMKDPGPSTISNVCGAVKCVVVVVSGRPIVIEPYMDSMEALVAAWLPGSEGQGVADVLFGDFGYTGRLPRTWFKSVGQLPMNLGDAHYDPLFPLDFGIKTEMHINGNVSRSTSDGGSRKPCVMVLLISAILGLWLTIA
ncbi:Lysosomal beta glucosidase [Linum perenne]